MALVSKRAHAALRATALAVPLLLARLANASTCYRADGNPFVLVSPLSPWVPCNASAEVSTCCSAGDYCLGNGLCLDAGQNNLYTIQGCTSPNWGAPCHRYCTSPMGKAFSLPDSSPARCQGNKADVWPFLSSFRNTDQNGYIRAWICDTFNNFCCGEDSTCCQTTSRQFAVSAFHTAYAAQSAAPSTTSSTTASSAAAGASSPTTTASSSASASSNLVASQTPSPPSSADPSSDTALKVGLGVGIPLGLVLLGAISWLAWELRKSRTRQVIHDPGARSDGMWNGQSQMMGSTYPQVQMGTQHVGELPAPRHPQELSSHT